MSGDIASTLCVELSKLAGVSFYCILVYGAQRHNLVIVANLVVEALGLGRWSSH